MKYGIAEVYADNGALSCHTIFDTDSGKHVGFVEDIADLRSQRKDSQRELKATQSALEQSQERCIAVTGERDELRDAIGTALDIGIEYNDGTHILEQEIIELQRAYKETAGDALSQPEKPDALIVPATVSEATG